MSHKRRHDSDSQQKEKKPKIEPKVTNLFTDYRDIAKLIANLLDYQSRVNFSSLCKDSLVFMPKRHVISNFLKEKGEKNAIPKPDDLLELATFDLRENNIEEKYKPYSEIKNIRIYSKWLTLSNTLCNCDNCFQLSMSRIERLFKKLETIELVRFPNYITFTIDSSFPNLRNFRFYSIKEPTNSDGRCFFLKVCKEMDELGLYSKNNSEIILCTSPEHDPTKIKNLHGNCHLRATIKLPDDTVPKVSIIELSDKRRVKFY